MVSKDKPLKKILYVPANLATFSWNRRFIKNNQEM